MTYVDRPGSYCEMHRPNGKRNRKGKDRFYDQHRRNPEAKRFYDSVEWRTVRLLKLAIDPICQRCTRAWAEHVHHVKPLSQCTPAERLAMDNLLSVCQPCHSAIEGELRKCT